MEFRQEGKKLSVPCLFYPAVKEAGFSIKEVLQDAEKQAEILVRIAEGSPVGAVIRMTELWCEAAAFGMECEIREDDFPRLGQPLFEEAEDLAGVAVPSAVNRVTAPLIEAIGLVASKIEKPLIVGTTGPFTLGAVLNGSENFMMNCMTDEEPVHAFLEKVTEFLISYLSEYKKAGARAVMVAEPSISMVSPAMAREFSNAYLQKVIHAVQDDNFSVVYHNCGAVNRHLDAIAELDAAAFHFGSEVNLALAFEKIGAEKAILGNIEPRLFLHNGSEEVRGQTEKLLQAFAEKENFVLSTGCDLSPQAEKASIQAFFSAADAKS